MPEKIRIEATDLFLATSEDKSAFRIIGHIVARGPQGPLRTDDTFRLTFTARQAMRLLAMLQEAQRRHNLARIDDPVEVLPSPKRRN